MVYSIEAKRSEILYRKFVAYCKANPAVCLRGTEIGSIDLTNLKTPQRSESNDKLALSLPSKQG